MRIQATKTMTRELNKAAKAAGIPYKLEHVSMAHNDYAWFVGDPMEAWDWGDFDPWSDKARAIQVNYPPEYYAAPRYLTSKDLNRLYEAGDTVETFAARVLEAIEI